MEAKEAEEILKRHVNLERGMRDDLRRLLEQERTTQQLLHSLRRRRRELVLDLRNALTPYRISEILGLNVSTVRQLQREEMLRQGIGVFSDD